MGAPLRRGRGMGRRRATWRDLLPGGQLSSPEVRTAWFITWAPRWWNAADPPKFPDRVWDSATIVPDQ